MKYFSTFPGQGTQYVGMLNDVKKEYLDLVSKTVPYHLDNTSNNFHSSIDIQLSMLIKQVYTSDCLKKEGFIHELVAGHSIGAFSAAVCANVLTLEEAIKLVFHRAKKMEEMYPKEKNYGIGVIIGTTLKVLQKHLDQFFSSDKDRDKEIYLSNVNSETQITISGKIEQISLFFDFLTKKEAVTVKLLNVPVPSHCQLMTPVVDDLEEISHLIEFKPPTCVYLSNVTGLPMTGSEEIKKDLLTNVAHPVLWNTMSEIAIELGIDGVIEFPPGVTLTKLMKIKAPHCRYIPIEQLGIDGTLYLLNKWRSNNYG